MPTRDPWDVDPTFSPSWWVQKMGSMAWAPPNLPLFNPLRRRLHRDFLTMQRGQSRSRSQMVEIRVAVASFPLISRLSKARVERILDSKIRISEWLPERTTSPARYLSAAS